MSANSDKRRRGDLDLFVLALIASGVATPYELKTAAARTTRLRRKADAT